MEYVNSLNAIKSTRTVSQVTKKTRSPTQIITRISLETVWTRIIFLHVCPQVLYYKCVKLHQYWFIGKGRVAFTRHMDSQMDRRMNRAIPLYPNNTFAVCWGTKTSITLPGSGEGSTDVEIVCETVPHGIHNK